MSEGQKNGPVRIDVEEAKELYDQGNVSVLDVIDTGSYNQFSYEINRAVRINPEDIADEYTELPKDQTILAY